MGSTEGANMRPTDFWPSHLPRRLARPNTTLSYNLLVSAKRYGDRTAIGFFGGDITYNGLFEAVERFAGWLQRRGGVVRGDRVALYLQNSPQYLIAYYGILRADAVVVPINPMNGPPELAVMLHDSGAKAVVCSSELVCAASEAANACPDVRHVIAATYSDYLPRMPLFDLPDWLKEPARPASGCVPWAELMSFDGAPEAPQAEPDDLCLLPYTSGSTGRPRACMHTSASFMHTVAGLSLWHGQTAATVALGLQPMYQIAGLANTVNSPIYSGGAVIPMPRWDRVLAARLIHHYAIDHVPIAPTAIIDLLADPELDPGKLSSVRRVTSGGAAMPAKVWARLCEALHLPFIEAYGMTEAGTIQINPVERPKPQCLGVAFFDTDARIIDPQNGRSLARGEPGEIVVRGPQLFRGYWGDAAASAAAFIELDGGVYYRTGDIGMVDEEGYFFMVDRLKRMINASGFKVWPNEVETKLYAHPDILEACVIGSADDYRGETVKALVVLKQHAHGCVRPSDIVDWAKGHMAAYKYPREIEFVESLPKSPLGKILWRELQEAENLKEGLGRAGKRVVKLGAER